jgi:L-amino acid N-acyltransferase YncA
VARPDAWRACRCLLPRRHLTSLREISFGSFETTAPTWDAFTAAKLPLHRQVTIDTTTGRVFGWVAATAVSSRCVYAGVVEHSIYVHPTRAAGASPLPCSTR